MTLPAAAGDPGRTTPGVVGSADVAAATATFAALVGDPQVFLDRHWAKAPMLRHHIGIEPTSLLSISDVDTLLGQRAPRLPVVRLVRDGQTIPPARFTRTARIGSRPVHDLIDPALISAEFASGATVSLQGLHRYWHPLTQLCAALEAALTHPFQANAYLSPAGATGLQVHHDTHDVFVLQAEGSKHFDVYEPATWLPVAGQHWTSAEPPDASVLSVDLVPGDCLYMPRGWRHRAFTTDSHSLHLTIGMLGYTWLALAGALSAALADDAAFREPLPAGFAHDPDGFAGDVAVRLAALRTWLEKADSDAVAQQLTRTFVTGGAHQGFSIEGTIHQRPVNDDTVVRRRRFARCLLTRTAGRVELVLRDRVVSFPAVAADVVSALITTESGCTAQDLPATLDLAGRLVVVRRLVAEGLLVAV